MSRHYIYFVKKTYSFFMNKLLFCDDILLADSTSFALQPHPFLIIDNPRQIGDACKRLENLNNCRSPCKRDWIRGIHKSWSYVCSDEGSEKYDKYRRCLKRISFRKDIKTCGGTCTICIV